jgi:hypothetical protein
MLARDSFTGNVSESRDKGECKINRKRSNENNLTTRKDFKECMFGVRL